MPQAQQQVTVTNLLEAPVFQDGKPLKERVASIAGVNFIQLTVKAGDELPSHHVNKAAFAVLLDGKARFPIYNTTYEIMPGAFLEIPKDAEHSVVAEEDSVILVGIIGETHSDEC